jgi:hypothetical protein
MFKCMSQIFEVAYHVSLSNEGFHCLQRNCSYSLMIYKLTVLFVMCICDCSYRLLSFKQTGCKHPGIREVDSLDRANNGVVGKIQHADINISLLDGESNMAKKNFQLSLRGN